MKDGLPDWLNEADGQGSEETRGRPSGAGNRALNGDRRRNGNGERRFEVQEIQANHREMIRLKMRGLTNIEIASVLDCTPQCVSDALNSTIVRKHMEELQLRRDSAAVAVQDELAELGPRPGGDLFALELGPAELVALQLDHGPSDPFIADQQIGPEAQDIHPDMVLVASPDNLLEVFGVPRPNEIVRRPTQAIPRVRCQRMVRLNDRF